MAITGDQQSVDVVGQRARQPRRALVLSGGGALAAYEVGVFKALLTGQSPATRRKSIDIDIVSATSAGSVNASLYLSVADTAVSNVVNYMEKVWIQDIGTTPGQCNRGAFRFRPDLSALLHPGCCIRNPIENFVGAVQDSAFIGQDFLKRTVNFVRSKEDIEQRTLEFVNLATWISDESYKRLLLNKVRFDKIRASSRTLVIGTTQWRTGELKTFGNSDMTEGNGAKIILASSAIPGVFGSVEINGEPYVDGGVVMNTPLKPAIDAGADELHVVYMDPEVARIPLPRLPNTASSFRRAIVISFSSTLKQDIQTAANINQEVLEGIKTGKAGPKIPHRPLTIHLHFPSQALGAGWFTFSRDNLQQLINQGFKDARQHDCARNVCILPEHQTA